MDEERHGVQNAMSTDMGSPTVRFGCSEGAGTSDECRREGNPVEDGAGHHSGEIRCEPSTLGTRSNSVRLYRNVLDGNDRPVAGSSGEEPAANARGDARYQLMTQIMNMPDGDPTLQFLQRFLVETGRDTSNTDTPTPTTAQRPVPHNRSVSYTHLTLPTKRIV